MIWDVHPGSRDHPGSRIRTPHNTLWREGGTYHDSATLVGDVPDLEAQLRVLGGRHQLSLDILHLVLVQLALRLPLRTSDVIE
jgi:hypothetical protein